MATGKLSKRGTKYFCLKAPTYPKETRENSAKKRASGFISGENSFDFGEVATFGGGGAGWGGAYTFRSLRFSQATRHWHVTIQKISKTK